MRGICLALPLLLAGCAGPAETTDAPRAVASATDRCREHGVLEAVCTQCNPKLAPVFQAKGDWCAEHGFPESFCPICHPERGGRPAGEVVAVQEEPPADRLKVRLASPRTAHVVGIDTEKVRPLAGSDGVVVPARLSYDAARRAEVNARSTGVVRSVHVDLGSRVRRGDPLVVLESAEVGADRSRLAAARAHEDVARAALERERALLAEGITPKREVEEAESALAAARGEVQALEAAAGVVGGGASSRYTLQAPLSGTVVRRLATVGRQVDSEEVLLEIADASVLWAEIDVPERYLPEISVGGEVALTFDGLPGRSFTGAIASIAPELDPRTRTAMARVRLANPDGALRAHMYGWARIPTKGAVAGARVPLSALQRASGVEIVFVRLTEALYETRRVVTAARRDGWVEVTRGVVPGEDVVTVGSFLLKTETLKGSIGAGCCE